MNINERKAFEAGYKAALKKKAYTDAEWHTNPQGPGVVKYVGVSAYVCQQDWSEISPEWNACIFPIGEEEAGYEIYDEYFETEDEAYAAIEKALEPYYV